MRTTCALEPARTVVARVEPLLRLCLTSFLVLRVSQDPSVLPFPALRRSHLSPVLPFGAYQFPSPNIPSSPSLLSKRLPLPQPRLPVPSLPYFLCLFCCRVGLRFFSFFSLFSLSLAPRFLRVAVV